MYNLCHDKDVIWCMTLVIEIIITMVCWLLIWGLIILTHSSKHIDLIDMLETKCLH